MSDVSIDPNVWGPAFWDILFYITFNVNVSKQHQNIHSLFHLLEIMLPCSQCRRHYAVYKKQVPAITNVRKDKKNSASMWLWIIHDMVNQNLGKICISYDKLEKKQHSLTCIVSDFMIFDIVVFVWMTSKQNPKVFEGLNILLDLLSSIRNFKVCQVLHNKIDTMLSYETLHECKNTLLTLYDYETVSIDDMRQSYSHAVVM